MGKGDKLLFPISFDLTEGVNQVIKQWDEKESKRLQKHLDKNPLKVSLMINQADLTATKSFTQISGQLLAAQKKLNAVNKQAADIEVRKAKAAELNSKATLNNAKAAEINLRVQERRATQLQRQKILDENAAAATARRRNAESKRYVQERTQLDQINQKKYQAEYAELRLAEAKKYGTQATMAQNAASRTQLGLLKRLLSRMAMYFSIYQVIAFANKIRETTAEFEKQRIALGALIRDQYKANAIFEQIKAQSVRSPYQIKDLVKYTKQLAAYGVEADGLVDTMNNLADISAGLGADMSRMILAFGQIKAAGVLKGTELRQLTETGLPMVELLAQYYSTLRGEVVRTSEVFDMISKKEIPFKVVQDILKDLSSEGGRFYEMQAKQAATLAGQWTNMKDTLSIMYDEIGRTKEVQSLMYGWIHTVKDLALNWRNVWSAVKMVGVSFLALKGIGSVISLLSIQTIKAAAATRAFKRAKQEANLVTLRANGLAVIHARQMQFVAYATRKAALAQNVLTKAMWKFTAWLASNPLTALMTLVSAIGLIVFKTKEARNEMDAFRDNLRETIKESAENTQHLVVQFNRLATEVVNSVDGSARQQEALRRLKNQFGEMFPDYKLTVDYLRKISEEGNGAANAFSNMTSRIKEFTAENMRQEAVQLYYDKLKQQFKDTFSALTDDQGSNFAKEIGMILDKAGDASSWEEFQEKIIKAFETKMGKTIKDTYAYQIVTPVSPVEITDPSYVQLVIKAARALGDESASIEQLAMDELDALGLLLNLGEAYYKVNGEVENMMSSFDKLSPKAAGVRDILKELAYTLKTIEKDTGGDTPEEIEKAIIEKTTEAVDAAATKLLQNEGLYLDVPVSLNYVIKTMNYWEDYAKRNGAELSDAFYSGINQLRGIIGDYDEEWRRMLASKKGFLFDGKKKLQLFTPDIIERFGNVMDSVDAVVKKYKELKDLQEKYAQNVKEGKGAETVENSKKQVKVLSTQMKWIEEYMKWLGLEDLLKDKKKGGSQLDELQKEVQLIEKIYAKYKEFRKYMSEAEAKAKTNEYFKDTIERLKYKPSKFTTEEKQQLLAQYRAAMAVLKDSDKAVLDVSFKIDDAKWEETKAKIQKALADLANKLSKTKEAKEFFDKMLGITGDKELSATLTMSIYGEEADKLGRELARQTAETFKQKYKGITFSDKAISPDGFFNWTQIEKEVKDKSAQIGKDLYPQLMKDIQQGRKEQSGIVAQFVSDLEAAKTYGEKLIKLHTKNQQRIAAIRATVEKGATQDYLLGKSKDAYAEEIDKLQYEAFKDSPLYIAMFEKLDSASTAMLKNMHAHLIKLKDSWGNLDPKQLKELQSRIQNIEAQLAKRNPFTSIINGLKEFNKLRETGSRKDAQRDAFNATQALLDAENKYQKAVESGESDDKLEGLAAKIDECVNAEKEATIRLQEWDSAMRKVMNGSQEMDQYIKLTKATTGAIKEVVEALGGWGDAAEQVYWETILNNFDKFTDGLQTAAQGIAQIYAGDIVGGITSIISGIGSLISAIAEWAYAGRIRRATEEIERQNDILSSLERSYKRLENAQEQLFGSELIDNYNQKIANLNAQIAAYRKQYYAEQSKGKKADETKMDDYKEAIRDTKDAIEELNGELPEHFLGTDLGSAARDFAKAWIDAYKEFGSTTDAISDKFQDMIENMIVESMAAQVMKNVLSGIFDDLDWALEDGVLDMNEASKIAGLAKEATANMDVGMRNLISSLQAAGISVRGMGGDLTGISRDIATASEESILGLAAGINTQNFYISQVPAKMDTIIGLLRGEGVTQGSAVTLQDLVTLQNQHLAHLPNIAQNTAQTVAECKAIVAETRRTADALERVIKPTGTQSTHKVNVTLS